MTVETDAYRSIMVADFGTTVTKADSSTFMAIFDNDFAEVGGTIRAVETLNPSIFCISSEVSDLVHNSVLTINSTTYHVIGIEPSGTGFTVLELEKQ